MSEALLAFDTDRIKDYVFTPGVLRDIRGASAILDELNRSQLVDLVQKSAPGARTIYAHGGSGLFVVDRSLAEAAKLAVQRQYARETESASITGAIVELPADVTDSDDLHVLWRQLAYRLRAAKDQNPAIVEATTHGLLRPCEACGIRYSTTRWSGPEGDQLLCASCRSKRDRDEQIRTRDIPSWLGNPSLTASASDSLWRRLIVRLRSAGYPLDPSLTRPRDFDTLAAVSRPAGYLGLIYADGDGIGRELERSRTLGTIRHFARAIDEAAFGTFAQAVTRHLRPELGSAEPIFPFDALLLGGDDLVLVTKAERALEVALTLVETFATETERLLGEPLRMSAAVILAHARYPFEGLLELAEGALAYAKREAARRAQQGEPPREGLVNFLVVNSASHADFATYVERVLRSRPAAPHQSLDRTLRPYTTTELRRLLRAARTLEGTSRTRLQRMREACFQDHLGGRFEALAAFLHWRDAAAKLEIQQLVTDLARSRGGGQALFPWFPVGQPQVWQTPLADLAEILDFVGPGEDHAAAS